MRLLVCVSALLLLYFSYETGRVARAQYFDDPTITFQNFTFDMAHRGSFNITKCMHEMINCWEIVRPDYICYEKYAIYDSVCTLNRQRCTERYGDYYTEPKFEMFESVCLPGWQQKWT